MVALLGLARATECGRRDCRKCAPGFSKKQANKSQRFNLLKCQANKNQIKGLSLLASVLCIGSRR
jgi:hypothetical protein